MENKQTPSKKIISIPKEKFIRKVDYDYLLTKPTRSHRKPVILDLEILKTTPKNQSSQKILVTINPRKSSIKTLYIAEKNRFSSKKGSTKSGSRLAIGDHISVAIPINRNDLFNSTECSSESSKDTCLEYHSTSATQETSSLNSLVIPPDTNVYNDKFIYPEKRYIKTQLPLNMNIPKLETKVEFKPKQTNKVDTATLIITNTCADELIPPIPSAISKLHKRIDNLERKVLKQEMVFRSLSPTKQSASDEDTNDIERTSSGTGRPGCSYIQQYSQVPETSAFQRFAQQAVPLSASKATTIEKEHNSEQYGRDFTAYDGITARGRRQCASMPCKRDETPKLAAERVHKIRNKLNPVRDYRLMDTIHYLAQGEFAPRDDGIKLTPSREAVLSDIIYEDVCRTHWPATRLGQRGHVTHRHDRGGTRCELQRLIDGLLRERVAHVERRRRRHYRIVKLNHRHENCRPPVGKTGDIIVASHKHKAGSEDVHDLNGSERHKHCDPRGKHRSEDSPLNPELRHSHRYRYDDCSPGTSHASKSPQSKEPTCCYQTTAKPKTTTDNLGQQTTQTFTESSSMSTCQKPLVKRETKRQKSKEEADLEHYILLPTLVVRTPSNMKRQIKFNDLYHRYLNLQLNSQNGPEEILEKSNSGTKSKENKKECGINIRNSISNNAEELNN